MIGQMNTPDCERFEQAMRGIFDRRHYTNHGPLVQELESRLQDFLGVRHAICVTNATIGLMIAIRAAQFPKQEITCPAFTFKATELAIQWAGHTPVLLDINDPECHLTHGADVGVHVWGNNATGGTIYDAAHAFGCLTEIGLAAVYSFHATKVLNGAEGGCIITHDDDMAERCRNIRSSYGTRETIPNLLTGNGRMSEAQAAMALLSLDEYPRNVEHNIDLHSMYENLLPGTVKKLHLAGHGNYQYVVIETDNRDTILDKLKEAGYECRKYFEPLAPLPVATAISKRVMQLPCGMNVTQDDVFRVCEVIRNNV